MKCKKNICYMSPQHSRSYLDIYLPDDDIRGVYVFFHGGGLESGSKEGDEFLVPYMLKKGIAVVLPEYRIYPDAEYPQFIEDAASAIAWVCDNISEFNGCKNVFIGGSSAGAYITMMLYFDKSYLGKYNLSPKDFRGFVLDAGQPTTHYNVLSERGIDNRRCIVDSAAPVYHITDYDGEPPVIIYVSDNDMQCRYEQTQLLMGTMKAFGYPEENITFHLMENTTHCLYYVEKYPIFFEYLYNFIDKILDKEVN